MERPLPAQGLPGTRGISSSCRCRSPKTFQIREHSDLSGVEEMVAQVMNSFAEHARREGCVAVQAPPHGSGLCQLSIPDQPVGDTAPGWKGRCSMAMSCHCPPSIHCSRGHHHQQHGRPLRPVAHVPTFCMGRALYDLPGLTTRGSLRVLAQTRSGLQKTLRTDAPVIAASDPAQCQLLPSSGHGLPWPWWRRSSSTMCRPSLPRRVTRGNTFRRCRGLGHPECILPPDRGDAHSGDHALASCRA